MTRCPTCFHGLTDGADLDACPHCNSALPRGWMRTGSTCVVMAGPRGTGKTIYIAVMIKQLMQYGEVAGMTVQYGSDQVKKVFQREYEGPLFEERGLPPSTAPAHTEGAYQRDPLIFVLRNGRGERHHLVIRDVAGEDLQAVEPDLENLRFFDNADAVLFLFDPLRVPQIARALSDVVADRGVSGDPTTVLITTLSLIGQSRPKLAVVMSKFDAMQALRWVERPDWRRIMGNAGAAIFRDPGWSLHNDDGELLHEEVRSLLIRLGSRSLITTLEAATHEQGLTYRFFAVSALGEDPVGTALHPRGIAPFRCLDPLRWALAGTGFL